jgi:DNA-binding transcriptional LysR family regulator
MNFQQLRIIRELTQHNLNLSQTAHALKTSQSGLSKSLLSLLYLFIFLKYLL